MLNVIEHESYLPFPLKLKSLIKPNHTFWIILIFIQKKWSLYWNLFYFYRFLEVGYWHPAQIFTFDCFLFYMEKSKIINFKRKLSALVMLLCHISININFISTFLYDEKSKERRKETKFTVMFFCASD